MDNPACSTLDVPSLHKTDHTNTSLFDDSEVALECHYNEAVIVDDEENLEKEDTSHGIDEVARLTEEDDYSDVVLNIMQSSPSWKNKDSSNENDSENRTDTIKLKAEDNCRISDGESCSSNSSSCLTFSDHYIKVSLFLDFIFCFCYRVKLKLFVYLEEKKRRYGNRRK